MAPHHNLLHDNFGVDYVITYRFADTCKFLHFHDVNLSRYTDSYS